MRLEELLPFRCCFLKAHMMPAKRSPAKEHILYHKDGSIWAKGQLVDSVMTGYWEWFRKDGTIMRRSRPLRERRTGRRLDHLR